MKTKLFTLFLALIASVGAILASDIQIDGIWYDFDDRNSIATVTYKGNSYSSYMNEYSGSIVVPVTVSYDNRIYNVTRIGDYAFSGCTELISVTIPKSVKNFTWEDYIDGVDDLIYIGDYAFSGCTGLTSIALPDSVYIYFSDLAFSGCTGLTSITLPDSFLDIGDGAFSGCTGLTSITIPNDTLYDTYIGDGAFYNCTGLTSITLPDYTYMGNGVFSGCTSLTSIVLPSSLESIGERTFLNCRSLTSVTIPNSVTSIGNRAFYACTSLTSITLPSSVTSIRSGAFDGCNNITSVVWEAKNCNSCNFGSQVETFIFGDSVEVVPDSLCMGMNKLTSITIPINVKTFGDDVFKGCTSIQFVLWNAQNCSDFLYRLLFGYWDSSLMSEQITSFVFGNEVKHIPARICYGMKNLTSISIPNSVTSIGESAFSGCSGLTSLTIPENVTNIGKDAFKGCSNLKSVIWNAKNCADLLSLSPPTKNPFFESNASIKSFVFGNNVRIIPSGTCCRMSNLETVVIGENVNYISYFAFNYSPKLSTIEWNAKFFKCIGKKSLQGGFYDLTPFYVRWVINGTPQPDDFGNPASNIKKIIIGPNVQDIDDAFYKMENVEMVICKNSTPPSIGKVSFDYSSSIPLCVPEQSIKKYKSSEPWKNFHPINPIEALENVVNEVIVTPTDSSLILEWPAIEDVVEYSIVIKRISGVTVCMLSFDGDGLLQSASFAAPARNGKNQEPSKAVLTEIGWRYEFSGLEGGKYKYSITARTENNSQFILSSGEFMIPIKTYVITFVNWNNTVLQTLPAVEKGIIPEYTGETPTRPDNDRYTFVFKGWTPQVVAANANATYKATYSAKNKGEDIEEVQAGTSATTKILRNGQIFILHADHTYTLTGQEVK